jgi:uncharacterized membrane protein YkvA (DUF1232 family)
MSQVTGTDSENQVSDPIHKITWFDAWKRRARELKRDTYALYLAYRDPRTPWYARLFGALVVAYAFSPIDLIPDFIPILGYLDDLILIPLGLAIVIRMIPEPVMRESRKRAQETLQSGKPVNRLAAVVIISIWITLLALVIVWILSIKR